MLRSMNAVPTQRPTARHGARPWRALGWVEQCQRVKRAGFALGPSDAPWHPTSRAQASKPMATHKDCFQSYTVSIDLLRPI